MKHEELIMGMPVRITLVGCAADSHTINEVITYFNSIDERYSTYKKTSEVSQMNEGMISSDDYSTDMKKILTLCERTKQETNGYFSCMNNDFFDPSGLVKGYAISHAANMIRKRGYKNFSVEIGGDIQVSGKNEQGDSWKVGIENPFNRSELVKVVKLENRGIATSGTYIRGNHIYNPHTNIKAAEIASITVIGETVYEADRFATAAFAMGEKGIQFIEDTKGLEGYLITLQKQALLTTGFEAYCI